MQISETLVKQIIDEVIKQVGQMDSASVAKAVSNMTKAENGVKTSGEVPSMAGRDRINEQKTDYSSYPKAKKGPDPKEIVIGVGAAFQK